MSVERLKAGEEESLNSSSAEDIGIGGFMAFARVNDSTAYTTDAPTSTVEDGSYSGDHLINQPIALSISGDLADIFIAESAPSRSEARLPTVGKTTSFLPERTPSQIQWVAEIIDTAQERKREIDEKILLGRNASDFTGNKTASKSIREQFIDFIESIHYGKQLISISMPFRKHDNMAITSVVVTRDNQRKALTFTLTAQKVRVSKTLFVAVSQLYRKPAPSVKSQTASTSDKGTQSPESTSGGARKEKSLLTSVLGR